jgi:outer membrane protein TolC
MNVARPLVALAAAALVAPVPGRAQQLPPPAPAAQPSADQPITVDQAISLALEQNQDLIRSLLQSQSSAQDLVLARSTILPSLGFNASVGGFRIGAGNEERIDPATGLPIPIRGSQSDTSYTVGASVRQLVFDGGKWWNNLEAADKQLAASRESIEEQKLTTVFNVRRNFFELVRALRTLDVLKEAAQRSRDQAESTLRLFEGGRATQADVYAARANRDNDEVNRLGQEAKVELARQDLAVVIGRDPAQPLRVVEPAELMRDPDAPPAAEQAVTRALAQRPSLKAFQLQLEGLRKSVDAAKGDYWPVVSVVGSYSRNTTALKTLVASPDKENTLSGAVQLNWNVFNGFFTTANVEKARIQVLLTQNDYIAGRRGVASDVERAIASWSSARAQARVAAQLQENAVKGLQLAKARQEVGVGTQLEVRDAELKVTQAQLSRVGALVDSHEAEAALRRATGDI